MIKRIREVFFERDRGTGVLVKRTICVEAEENVPVGCEIGYPKPWRYFSFREKIANIIGDYWPLLILLAIIPLAILAIAMIVH